MIQVSAAAAAETINMGFSCYLGILRLDGSRALHCNARMYSKGFLSKVLLADSKKKAVHMIHKWSDWFLMLTSLKLRCKVFLIFFGGFLIFTKYISRILQCVLDFYTMCGKSISSSGV